MKTTPLIDPLTRRAIAVLDVSELCMSLGIDEDEVRQDLLDAAAAGLLRAERITPRRVVLRGTFPDEGRSERKGHIS